MHTLVCAGLALVLLLAGCARPQQYDLMSAPPVCDTVPIPLRAEEQVDGTIPTARRPGLDSALVIGTLVEAKTGRALSGGSIALIDGSAPMDLNRPTAIVGMDRNAGFVIIAPKPGRYILLARRIGYSPTTRAVALQAGSVDTLRLELQYQHCVGY